MKWDFEKESVLAQATSFGLKCMTSDFIYMYMLLFYISFTGSNSKWAFLYRSLSSFFAIRVTSLIKWTWIYIRKLLFLQGHCRFKCNFQVLLLALFHLVVICKHICFIFSRILHVNRLKRTRQWRTLIML